MTIEDHIIIIIAIPVRPQINVMRQEPGTHMCSRIKYLINVYLTSHGVILTAVFSVQGPVGSEVWGSVVLLSGVVSTVTILLLLRIFVQQFNDLPDGGRGERELLNSVVEKWRWIAGRGAFVLMLMGLSVCLCFTCSRQLFSRIP